MTIDEKVVTPPEEKILVNEIGEFAFASWVLSNRIENYLPEDMGNTRDYIFREILEEFESKPVKIFQIGAIETFKNDWRVGSGWSDIIFGEHIKKHGGILQVVDINLDHLANSVFAARCLGYKIQAQYGDAIDVIEQEDFDIYYLDGGNDPEETLDQFNRIKDKNCIIIVDDFEIKGTLLDRNKYNFVIHDVAHKVGTLDLRNTE